MDINTKCHIYSLEVKNLQAIRIRNNTHKTHTGTKTTEISMSEYLSQIGNQVGKQKIWMK